MVEARNFKFGIEIDDNVDEAVIVSFFNMPEPVKERKLKFYLEC